LARRENYGMALSAFRRAVGLSRKIGSRNRAAEVALVAFQEMEERLAVMGPQECYYRAKLVGGNTITRTRPDQTAACGP